MKLAGRLMMAFLLPLVVVVGDVWINDQYSLPFLAKWLILAISIIVGAVILATARWTPLLKACSIVAYVPAMVGLVIFAGLSKGFP